MPSPPSPAPPPAMAEDSDGSRFLAPLRLRGFRHLAVGQLVSSCGNAMYKVAHTWLLAGVTHGNGTRVGLLAVFQLAPLLLFSGYGGWIADRFPRRRTLLVTQTTQAALCAVLAVLSFAGSARLWEIYLLALCAGTVTVVDNPARQRFLTDLVGETRLSRALGLYTALLNIGQILGPLAAGLIIGWAQVGWIFVADATSFLVVAGVVLAIPDPGGATGAGERFSGLLPGLRAVAADPALALTVAASAVVGSVGVQFTVTNTLMAVRVFHLTAASFALLPTAVTVGCLFGALLAGRRDPGPRTVLAAAAATGLTGAVSGLAPSYPGFALSLVVAGAAAMYFTTSAAVLLQMRSAAELRGRVLAVQNTALYGSGPVGAVLVGAATGPLGPRATLVSAGLLTVALCVAIATLAGRTSRKAQTGQPRPA
ncbi:MFS transporter [Streptomyces sp. NPDC049099]|uniref:MFS transporter n=1 Tax=Streptomyces sp. NPDC049099 TaxID=3155768 RepID=UPI003417EC84